MDKRQREKVTRILDQMNEEELLEIEQHIFRALLQRRGLEGQHELPAQEGYLLGCQSIPTGPEATSRSPHEISPDDVNAQQTHPTCPENTAGGS